VRADWLRAKICTRVYEHFPGHSIFEFGDGSLDVECLWRIIVDGRIALTSRDHGQQFGLPAPVDAHAEAASLLQGRRVVAVRLQETSADLTLEFEGGLRLEVISESSGYEPWNFHAPGVHLVGLGGGGVADFYPPNVLTDLLRGKTTQEVYGILMREQCLSAEAIKNPDQVTALIEQTDAAARQAGPGVQHWIVGALLKASYLNGKGRRLLTTSTVERRRNPRRWWRLW
jgi:hypothetical protein